jgi:hypothetical protein
MASAETARLGTGRKPAKPPQLMLIALTIALQTDFVSALPMKPDHARDHEGILSQDVEFVQSLLKENQEHLCLNPFISHYIEVAFAYSVNVRN